MKVAELLVLVLLHQSSNNSSIISEKHSTRSVFRLYENFEQKNPAFETGFYYFLLKIIRLSNILLRHSNFRRVRTPVAGSLEFRHP